jgi:hypothetical protein
LPLVGISFAVKESIRKQHPQYGQERIEVDHIIPRHQNGTSDRSNLQPLSIVEHAEKHWTAAVHKAQYAQARKDYGGVRLIVMRMTEQELNAFNEWLSQQSG